MESDLEDISVKSAANDHVVEFASSLQAQRKPLVLRFQSSHSNFLRKSCIGPFNFHEAMKWSIHSIFMASRQSLVTFVREKQVLAALGEPAVVLEAEAPLAMKSEIMSFVNQCWTIWT